MQLTFTVLKKEGDLRFNLVRTRENSGGFWSSALSHPTQCSAWRNSFELIITGCLHFSRLLDTVLHTFGLDYGLIAPLYKQCLQDRLRGLGLCHVPALRLSKGSAREARES